MLIAFGCSSSEEKESAPVVSVQAAAAKTQTIEDEISTDAILYPHDQAAIVPKLEEWIAILFVPQNFE